MKAGVKEYLHRLYFSPEKAASFSGPRKFYNAVRADGKHKVSFSEIQNWLQTQQSYALYKQPTKKFLRSSLVTNGMNDVWECDLAQLEQLANENDGITYLLCVVDKFSRFGWAVGMKNKTAKTTAEAMKSILHHAGVAPNLLISDRGSEFLGRQFQTVLKQNSIKHQTSYSSTKAGSAEIFVKSVKSRIFKYIVYINNARYIDQLDQIIAGYNATRNRAIGMAPKDVTKDNQDSLWWYVYRPKHISRRTRARARKYKFQVGDYVRLTYKDDKFTRFYDLKWTMEIFIVAKRSIRDGIQIYYLKDIAQDDVTGTFYAQELQKTDYDENAEFKIEKILKKRHLKGQDPQVLVQFLGWPKKFNAWLKATDIQAI